jgi:hypothetical protein
MRAPILPRFQRQISENRIGGSNEYLPAIPSAIGECETKVRVVRAEWALLAQEPNQENAKNRPVAA